MNELDGIDLITNDEKTRIEKLIQETISMRTKPFREGPTHGVNQSASWVLTFPLIIYFIYLFYSHCRKLYIYTPIYVVMSCYVICFEQNT